MANRQRRHVSQKRRILSIDPRISRIGFAYVEGDFLADWGVKNARSGVPAVRLRRLLIPTLITMLDLVQPDVLLVPDTRSGAVRRSNSVAEVIDAVVHEATTRDVSVHHLSNEQIKNALSTNGVIRSHVEMCEALVKVFPELLSSVPRGRRTWEPERYFTPMFVAVAMYCAWRLQT